jgi:mono/diheme cytochrome c family protein
MRRAGSTLAVLLVCATTAWATENVASAVVTRQATVTPSPAPEAGSAPSAADRGRAVFESRCVTCHGANGKGDGRVAKLYNPKPSDLTTSTKSDTYKAMIIRKGGAYVGRSLIMPSWESELSAEEIGDVVSYLAVLAGNGG